MRRTLQTGLRRPRWPPAANPQIRALRTAARLGGVVRAWRLRCGRCAGAHARALRRITGRSGQSSPMAAAWLQFQPSVASTCSAAGVCLRCRTRHVPRPVPSGARAARRIAPGDHSGRDARLCSSDAVAVQRVEALERFATFTEQQAAIRQHAVHIEKATRTGCARGAVRVEIQEQAGSCQEPWRWHRPGSAPPAAGPPGASTLAARSDSEVK